MERLTYVLSNGVKEGLVEKVLDWPGVHAAPPQPCSPGSLLRVSGMTGPRSTCRSSSGRRPIPTASPSPRHSRCHLSLVGSTCRQKPTGLESRASSGKLMPTRQLREKRAQTSRSRCDPAPGSEDRAEPDQEVASPSVSRHPEVGPQRALPGLHPLRAGLPRGRRAVEDGESQRCVPKRVLPAAFTLCGITPQYLSTAHRASPDNLLAGVVCPLRLNLVQSLLS